jgi:hypothetical protein
VVAAAEAGRRRDGQEEFGAFEDQVSVEGKRRRHRSVCGRPQGRGARFGRGRLDTFLGAVLRELGAVNVESFAK